MAGKKWGEEDGGDYALAHFHLRVFPAEAPQVGRGKGPPFSLAFLVTKALWPQRARERKEKGNCEQARSRQHPDEDLPQKESQLSQALSSRAGEEAGAESPAGGPVGCPNLRRLYPSRRSNARAGRERKEEPIRGGGREAGSGNSGRGVSGGAGMELMEWTPLRLVGLQEEAAGGLPVAVSAVLGHRGTRPSFSNRPWRGKCRLDFPILCLAAVNFPFNNPPDRIGGDGKKLEGDGPGPLHVGGGSVVAGFALLESAPPQTAACLKLLCLLLTGLAQRATKQLSWSGGCKGRGDFALCLPNPFAFR
ncbi:Hypothetical predicted protein [Podarcis lilfordi]|uniref:Uncharacterized protein n=1 Tax=Podarcis lilfordi TaxID=74358 RepID=A0AA35PLI4_9SAUR|nr:Hypothetical predicted protein [Podarcis lilfordi]